MVCLRPQGGPCRHPTNPSRPIVSRPVKGGVGSPILRVALLRFAPRSARVPSHPRELVGCRGSFLPLVKKDPHHQQIYFRHRRGSFPRRTAAIRTAHASPYLARPLRMDFGEPEWAGVRGPRAKLSSWSTISVVNYLSKVGDHTTPPWDDISLTSRRAAVCGNCLADSARAHRHSRPWTTPSADLRPWTFRPSTGRRPWTSDWHLIVSRLIRRPSPGFEKFFQFSN